MATPEFKQKLHSILASFENKASTKFAPELTGYIPNAGTSGVTIATGFDLGQHSAADIKNLKLPKTLEAKLLPFAKSKDAKKAANLKVTAEEAKLIDNAVMDKKYEEFSSGYTAKFGQAPEKSLDENTRLALMSSFFNMGGKIFNEKENPSMVAALQSGDIKQIHKQIADFHQGGSGQPLSRRLAEAAVASGFIDATDPTSLSNFKDLMSKNPQARTAYRQNWQNIEPVASPKTSDQQIPYPVTPEAGKFDSMKDLLRSIGEKVTSFIPSAQAAEVIPQQPEPQYATMEDLLMDRGLMKNPFLLDPKDAETMWRQF